MSISEPPHPAKRETSSPYIILTRPICANCGATMRLVRIDLHPLYLTCEVCRFDCPCGATQSNTVDHRRASVVLKTKALPGETQPST
jgi:hypothetical protein